MLTEEPIRYNQEPFVLGGMVAQRPFPQETWFTRVRLDTHWTRQDQEKGIGMTKLQKPLERKPNKKKRGSTK
jgi:hypothetical protein